MVNAPNYLHLFLSSLTVFGLYRITCLAFKWPDLLGVSTELCRNFVWLAFYCVCWYWYELAV